jgi:hypothetical protein
MLTIDDLKARKMIIFEGIVGSQAYGIATPTSDVDIKGVFIQPLSDILGMGYIEQVSDDTNDTTYYEIKRFLQLLATNNPNILELMALPSDCIKFKDPVFDLILDLQEELISKKCQFTFGGYASEQIKKARGMNKKIMNPVEPERKSILDFCFVPHEQGSIKVEQWLADRGLKQEDCGLVGIDHMRFTYGLYHSVAGSYRGIVSDREKSNDICLSDIPKGEKSLTIVQVNHDGYSTYCRQYKEYWEWVKKRNPHRYNDNMSHGGGYDGKNLAHCHRLLDMALEIGRGEGINVRRNNREQLLAIRKGEYLYEDILNEAESKIKEMDEVYKNSKLPSDIDMKVIDKLLIKIRMIKYGLLS